MFEGLGIPVGLLSALCFVESSHRDITIVDTNGRVSHGICQVQAPAAKQVGLHPSTLLHREGVIRAAQSYLSYGYRRCGTWMSAVGFYNSGRCGRTTSPYVRKVLTEWAKH